MVSKGVEIWYFNVVFDFRICKIEECNMFDDFII